VLGRLEMQHAQATDGHAVAAESGRFRVRHLVLAPGEAVGPVAHLHSSKHLTVTGGACRIDIGGTPIHLHETQSLDVPAANAYRIENHGKVDLHLVEIRIGDYLGDDDIAYLDLTVA
jgi:mannose-6-phosphate isomerase-like protein (cupin superfamily)